MNLGRADASRREAYRRLFKPHIEPELINDICQSTNDNFALGSEWFKEEVSAMLK